MFDLNPLIILGIGIAVVLGMIIVLRINAFVALISAAIVVSLLAPGDWAVKISRVAEEFGKTVGNIGIVIAMAAIIGKCLTDSGAADRVVRMFTNFLGEKRAPVSLMASGFVLSVPVFFDTVFYLLLPLARSMHRKTGLKYLLLILAMGAGASITHSLVPPTPGPLLIAGQLKIDVGMMMMIGLAVSIPTAAIIYFFIRWLTTMIDIPMRPIEGGAAEPEPLPDDRLPGLFVSILPIILPVILISANTILLALAKKDTAGAGLVLAANITAVVGNANLAMLISAAIALAVLYCQRKPTRQQMAEIIESSLMSAGVIILITAAGGAFGAMLREAQIGPAIENLFVGGGASHIAGLKVIFMGFAVACLLKFAQGSSTVSMITTAGMMASLILGPDGSYVQIGYHPVYVAAAIGFGAQCGNWMNDSGFWVFAKMGGLTEVETLRTWTVTVSLMAVIGLFVTVAFAKMLPLV
ncbi:MAG TPA: SLC13 family permease [Anaerohalosphaeraceae bacterium]|nr:SLC13 family permease [Anaerohalosphaeraceae bacterium]HRT51118.1 SLC13 family permease [Anaerohalosphaeraceae bacterium]HRT87133.1 SLC13 family permease [Anaerohalosphaeraceae bacterium]